MNTSMVIPFAGRCGALLLLVPLLAGSLQAQQVWPVADVVTCDTITDSRLHVWHERWQVEHQLREAVQGVAAELGEPQVRGLIVVRYDSLTRATDITYLLQDVPEGIRDRIQQEFTKRLAASGAAESSLLLRLEEPPIASGDAAALVICCPSLWNRQVLGSQFWRVYRASPHHRALRRQRRELRMVADLVVSREGRVVHVSVVESTGNADLDQQLSGVFSHARFDPVTVAGVPRDSRVLLPVMLADRQSRR
jgi:TonB family protein